MYELNGEFTFANELVRLYSVPLHGQWVLRTKCHFWQSNPTYICIICWWPFDTKKKKEKKIERTNERTNYNSYLCQNMHTHFMLLTACVQTKFVILSVWWVCLDWLCTGECWIHCNYSATEMVACKSLVVWQFRWPYFAFSSLSLPLSLHILPFISWFFGFVCFFFVFASAFAFAFVFVFASVLVIINVFFDFVSGRFVLALRFFLPNFPQFSSK